MFDNLIFNANVSREVKKVQFESTTIITALFDNNLVEISVKAMRRRAENGFEEWGGYMEAKKSKLEEQFNSEAGRSGLKVDDLFKDIAIFVNGYTVPPADELRYLMLKHGGTYHHYYRSNKTTHVIASNLPDSKVRQLKGLTVVKPSWIVDSISAGKLLNHKDYLLYSNQSKTQPVINFQPKVRSPTKTASDDKFLSEFYGNSRLHLISTMGAMFKQYINELREKHMDFPGREVLQNSGNCEEDFGCVIMHIDMDCFFVSVGLRDRPDLIGEPVVVTHSRGNKTSAREGVDRKAEYIAYSKGPIRSDHWSHTLSDCDSMAEIASCSYEARQAGIKNGMFLGQALKLCPNLKMIPYNFEGYKQVSYILYNTVARYTLNIEAMSCDEMFVDCTELLSSTKCSPMDFATIIRKEIRETTGCNCSTGFGQNRLLARLATRKAKPNGQYIVEPSAIIDFISPVSVSDLPGVGRSTSYKLRTMGIDTCLDLQKVPLPKLRTEFGSKLGETLHKNSFGKDEKGLTFTKVRKSVSAEVNYGIRFQSDDERDNFLKQLAEEVCKRLCEVNMKGRNVTLRIMVKAKNAPEESAKFLGHGVCDYYTKSNSLKSATDDPVIILKEVNGIMKQLNVPSKDLRGIGIQMSKLVSKIVSKNSLDNFFCGAKDDKAESNEGDEVAQSEAVCGPPGEGEQLNCQPTRNEPQPRPGPSRKVNLDTFQPSLHNVSLSQIDPSFLEAMPVDLKNEIINAVKTKPKSVNAASSTVTCEKPAIDSAPQSHPECSTLPKEKGARLDVSVKQMRVVVREWVESGMDPLPSDVSLFSEYLSSLVSTHQMDQAAIILRTLYRSVTRELKDDLWKRAYEITVDQVQSRMLEVYGSKLMLKEVFM